MLHHAVKGVALAGLVHIGAWSKVALAQHKVHPRFLDLHVEVVLREALAKLYLAWVRRPEPLQSPWVRIAAAARKYESMKV